LRRGDPSRDAALPVLSDAAKMRMAAGSGNLRNLIRANSARSVTSAAGSGRIAATGSGRIASGRLGSGRLMRKNTKLVKGVKHVVKGQVPVQFRFEMLVEFVDKLTTSERVCVIWERSKETDGTKAVDVDPSTRRATFNESITKDVTLFKEKVDDQGFADKIFKLGIRAGNLTGATLGKIHINFAEYVSDSVTSKRCSFNLSNGSCLVATLQSTLLNVGKKSSGVTSDGGGASNDNVGSDQDFEDDFEDLGDLDDAEEDEAGNEEVSAAPTTPKAQSGARRVSDGALGAAIKADLAEGGKRNVAVLKRKCEQLQKRVKDLEKQNAVLMEDLAAAENNQGATRKMWGKKPATTTGPGSFQNAAAEIQFLRSEIGRLEVMVCHEPEFHALVAELKEVKMTLAMANLEKEQAKLDLMNYTKMHGTKGKKSKRSKKK